MIYRTKKDAEKDKRKFERIYLDYKQTMFYAANRILKDEYLAEDAVHSAFIRIIDGLEKIDENNYSKTRAYLTVIVKHISIDIYRKRKKENLVSYEKLEIYLQDLKPISLNSKDGLLSVIKKLPVNYSTVLILKFFEGYNDVEIARILSISKENVRKRTSRAKKMLSFYLNNNSNVDKNDAKDNFYVS